MAFEIMDESNFEEGELISELDELRKYNKKNKLLKKKILNMKEDVSHLVNEALKTQLEDIENFREALIQ